MLHSLLKNTVKRKLNFGTQQSTFFIQSFYDDKYDDYIYVASENEYRTKPSVW